MVQNIVEQETFDIIDKYDEVKRVTSRRIAAEMVVSQSYGFRILIAVVIFDHGRKFGIVSFAPDHPAPRESFAIEKNTKLFLNIFFYNIEIAC